MDDLMKCLYEFTTAKRMGAMWDDPEYEEMTHSVELQTAKVQEGMDKEQLRELRLLLENVSAQKAIESEHLFRASLKLARELNALVGA